MEATMPVRPPTLLTLAAYVLLLAGCGGGQPSHPASGQQTTTASPTATATAGTPLPATSAPSPASPVASGRPSPPPSPRAIQALPTGPPPTPVQTLAIGRSVQGRPITAVEFGDPSSERKLLVVGCIHGNEPAGIAIARQLERLTPPAGTDVWVIENLNPDGAAANTRQNAQGVDLNRNFPYGWQPLDSPGGLMYSGPGPLSEPESKLAVEFLNRIRPSVSIWYHQHLDLVDLSGGDASLEQRYAAMVGLKAEQLQRYPGSVTSWENHAFPGSTAFVVELPAGSLTDAAANRYAAAALKIL
jgi:protein MpaA